MYILYINVYIEYIYTLDYQQSIGYGNVQLDRR